MTSLPTFPTFDLTSFDLSKLPTFELPHFDLPKVGLPRFDVTKVDDKVVGTVRNAAYLTVGLGVAAFERLDGARRSANAIASDTLGSVTTAMVTGVRRVAKIVA